MSDINNLQDRKVAASKRIGWDKREVTIPTPDAAKDLVLEAQAGDDNALDTIVNILRFAASPTDDDQALALATLQGVGGSPVLPSLVLGYTLCQEAYTDRWLVATVDANDIRDGVEDGNFWEKLDDANEALVEKLQTLLTTETAALQLACERIADSGQTYEECNTEEGWMDVFRDRAAKGDELALGFCLSTVANKTVVRRVFDKREITGLCNFWGDRAQAQDAADKLNAQPA